MNIKDIAALAEIVKAERADEAGNKRRKYLVIERAAAQVVQAAPILNADAARRAEQMHTTEPMRK